MKLPLKMYSMLIGLFSIRDADNKRIATDLRYEEAALIIRAANAHEALIEALGKIAEGKGAFNLDPLKHCANCLEDAKAIAVAAIAAAEEEAP